MVLGVGMCRGVVWGGGRADCYVATGVLTCPENNHCRICGVVNVRWGRDSDDRSEYPPATVIVLVWVWRPATGYLPPLLLGPGRPPMAGVAHLRHSYGYGRHP